MAESKPTHVVKHKKLYLSVNGVLQHVPAGTQLTLTEKQAKGLGGKVVTLAEAKKIDLTGDAKAKAPVPPAPGK